MNSIKSSNIEFLWNFEDNEITTPYIKKLIEENFHNKVLLIKQFPKKYRSYLS